MTQSPKKRVRKPKELKYKYCGTPYLFEDQGDIIIFNSRLSLKWAKKIHNWLGRAIQYLEHKGE